MTTWILAFLVLFGFTGDAQRGERWPRPDKKIDCGPLVFEVYVSHTAHLFHVVDQLSAWDNACHGQYRESMALSEKDEEMLAAFAEVRKQRRWGQGLEETFYTPLNLERAVSAGRKAGHITRPEAEVIVPVLKYFAPRVEELLSSREEILLRAFAEIDTERFEEAAKKLARFTGVKKLVVPTFPLASPGPGGGGMDGGRLRWEIDSADLRFSVLLHEATHGFFMQKNYLLAATVERTPGMTMTLLGEGFAYAIAPGLYGDGDGDNLAYNVAKDRENKEAWEDPSYGRQRTYALALRPILAEALVDQTLEEFLPRARDVYLGLREVFEAQQNSNSSEGPPKLLIAGPTAGEVRTRISSHYPMWITDIGHDPVQYGRYLPSLGRGDLFVICIAGNRDGLPKAYAELSPIEFDELQARMKRGETVAEEHKASTGYRVILLAAPTVEELKELVDSTSILSL